MSCSNCERPICPDCMTPTSVGMRCPECARQKTQVRRAPSARFAGGGSESWSATNVLIAINVAVFVIEMATGVTPSGGGWQGSWLFGHASLFGSALTGTNPNPSPFNGSHQYWRLLSAGFLHASLIHVGLNMLSLWFVGRVLEPGIGTRNFLVIYLVSLLAGSFGSLAFEPNVPTVGASTAIFGIFGALIVVAYDRGIPIWQSGLGPMLAINLIFTLTVSEISIGGHLGGLLGGVLCGIALVRLGERRRSWPLALGICAGLAVLAVIGSLLVASGPGLTPNGWTL